MAEDYLQIQAGQTGDKVRTARKTTTAAGEVHEEYVISDVPWRVVGSYSWSGIFSGFTGVGTAGILAAIYRGSAASNLDIVLRRLSLGFFNEGTSAANFISMGRTSAFPPSSAAEMTTAVRKDSRAPQRTASIYLKPTGVTMSAAELSRSREIWPKPSTGGAYGAYYDDFIDDAEPFILTSDEALVLYQQNAGTTTEKWMVDFEWQEVAL